MLGLKRGAVALCSHEKAVRFQEQYFRHEIEMLDSIRDK